MPSQSPTTTVHAACAEFVDEPRHGVIYTEPNHYLAFSTSPLKNIQNLAGATGKYHAPQQAIKYLELLTVIRLVFGEYI
jgi:hypothetical protein